MAASRPTMPAAVRQLSTGDLLNADPQAIGRLLTDLKDAQEASEDRVRQLVGSTDASAADLAAAIAAVPVAGRLIGRQILTGSGIYTPTPGTKSVVLRGCGGGGGGGGAGGGANFAAGGGGTSGVSGISYLLGTSLAVGGAFAGGAAGAAGSSAGGNGGLGGDSTIVINGVTYTYKGGGGGLGMTSVVTGFAGFGVAPVAGSSGDVTTYQMGTYGLNLSGSFIIVSGGGGGSSIFGAGGAGLYGVAQAGFAGGPGAGGGGASANAVGFAGGAGGAGMFIVEEYS